MNTKNIQVLSKSFNFARFSLVFYLLKTPFFWEKGPYREFGTLAFVWLAKLCLGCSLKRRVRNKGWCRNTRCTLGLIEDIATCLKTDHSRTFQQYSVDCYNHVNREATSPILITNIYDALEVNIIYMFKVMCGAVYPLCYSKTVIIVFKLFRT